MDTGELLIHMSKMYNFSQVDSGDWSAWEEIPHVDDPAKARDEIKGEGLELVDIGDPGDAITALFVDGELKLTAYMSTRGSLYQAGAYDGEKEYGASNLKFVANLAEHPQSEGGWLEYEGYPCASIARKYWQAVNP